MIENGSIKTMKTSLTDLHLNSQFNLLSDDK